MNRKQWKQLILVSFVLLICVAAGTALAGDKIGYAGSWEELNDAAINKVDTVIITADIFYQLEDVTVVFKKPVTIQSAEGEHFIIDGGKKQILCVQGTNEDNPFRGVTVVKNLTFQYGNAQTYSKDVLDSGAGGALFVLGSLEVEDCIFLNNTANYGGAICTDKSLTITNCTFKNSIGVYGGCIYAYKGDVNMNSGEIADNSASSQGGAIFVYKGNVEILDGTIKANKADKGGGIFVEKGDVHIAGGEITENRAMEGGGTYVLKGDVEISGGKIFGNIASNHGGAICIEKGDLSVSGGEISGNRGTYSGGGAYIVEGTVTGEVSLIFDNLPNDVWKPE